MDLYYNAFMKNKNKDNLVLCSVDFMEYFGNKKSVLIKVYHQF